MPALPPYIPNRDSLLNNWAANFSTLLSATPATYGQSATTAATVAALELTWANAYTLVTSPTTKTAATVQQKNIARVNFLNTARIVAQQISLSPGVATSDKIAIGVNPRTTTPTPITNPTTYPVLSVLQSLALAHVISYRDQLASPSIKAKPYGVAQMYLYGNTSVTPVTDPATLTFLGGRTKSPFTQTFPSSAQGLRVYYAARWATRNALLGPWSPIVSFIVAA